MFGMGFTEILLIAIVAIIALGPEKLPSAMVDIAKFFRKLKSGVEDAKSTLDSELNITEMKDQANQFKAQIENTKSTMNLDYLDSITDDDTVADVANNEKKIEDTKTQEKPKKREKVTFKKKKEKKEKKESKEA